MVAGQMTPARDPGETAFHHPTSEQENETPFGRLPTRPPPGIFPAMPKLERGPHPCDLRQQSYRYFVAGKSHPLMADGTWTLHSRESVSCLLSEQWDSRVNKVPVTVVC